MDILVLGDIHGRIDILTEIIRGEYKNNFDCIVCVGDFYQDINNNFFIDIGSYEYNYILNKNIITSALKIMSTLKKPILFVLGNWDFKSSFVNNLERPFNNIDVLLGNNFKNLNNYSFIGIGGIPSNNNILWTYGWSERELDKKIKKFKEWNENENKILVSHCPPKNTYLDVLSDCSTHVGSTGIRRILKDFKPNLVICGHVHESTGVDIVDSVPVLNVGSIFFNFCNFEEVFNLNKILRRAPKIHYFIVSVIGEKIKITERIKLITLNRYFELIYIIERGSIFKKYKGYKYKLKTTGFKSLNKINVKII